MHPAHCPAWEYKDHPQRSSLNGASFRVYEDLANGSIDTLEAAKDTRSFHSRFFSDLTPSGYEYFAGHYRGEDYECLRFYSVTVRSDPTIGINPELVLPAMMFFQEWIEDVMKELDDIVLVNSLSPVEKLRRVVNLACLILVDFLHHHPYANGNGHAGRFLLVATLQRYGYQARRFSIDPRPDGPYIRGIKSHRDGDPTQLEEFVLGCVAV